MIGFLKGKVKFKQLDQLILSIKGVGYLLYLPVYDLSKAKIEDKKEYYVYTYVKEDEISLFGFSSIEDKQIFVLLNKVSGIGPRTALNIVSFANGAKNIQKAISDADVEFFSSLKGLGKKTAQRIIVDLKSKIGGLKDLEFETEEDRDLLDALQGLGFSQQEIRKSIKKIKKDLPLEEKIKHALKQTNEKK